MQRTEATEEMAGKLQETYAVLPQGLAGTLEHDSRFGFNFNMIGTSETVPQIQRGNGAASVFHLHKLAIKGG